MDVTSFLLAEWYLWLRGALLAAAGYFLCRRRNYLAVPVALLASYWAYDSISFMVEFRTDVLEQVGLTYMIQAHAALLMPFAFMSLGLFLHRKPFAENASPNGGPAASDDSSNAPGGPPSVS
jgi:hypothetical protein